MNRILPGICEYFKLDILKETNTNEKILICSEGMDIYYQYNLLAEEKFLGMLFVENENIGKVFSFRALETEFLVRNSEKINPLKIGWKITHWAIW